MVSACLSCTDSNRNHLLGDGVKLGDHEQRVKYVHQPLRNVGLWRKKPTTASQPLPPEQKTTETKDGDQSKGILSSEDNCRS